MRTDERFAAATFAPPIRIAYAALRTPIGRIQVAASMDRVLYLQLPNQRSQVPPFADWLRGPLLQKKKTPALEQALRELEEYFEGTRRCFQVPIAPAGTQFQQRVWGLIATIAFGETRTYGDLASQLGNFNRARVVGAAVGANPIPIIIPCHRVIASDGAMAGFGGGLSRKVWLLRHEGVLLT